MFRWLFVLVLVIAITPFAYLAGFGFYHGLNVINGIETFTLSLINRDLVYSENNRVDASELETADVEIIWRGKLENERLEEASGLAFGAESDVLFSVNDSGNAPELFAVGLDGKDVGVWPIDYARNHDFEDMASFEFEGGSYLLVADTGDNLNWRPHLTLLALEEPTMDSVGEMLEPVWTVEFRFPKGYRDVEGVAVDEKDELVYLISKRRIPAEVFTVPLKAEGVVTAQKVASLRGVPAPTARDLREDPNWGRASSSPTAFDLHDRTAMVVTYKEAYLFQRARRDDWAKTFSGLPKRVPLPEIWGLESGALGSSDVFYVTGEREDGIAATDVFEVRLP